MRMSVENEVWEHENRWNTSVHNMFFHSVSVSWWWLDDTERFRCIPSSRDCHETKNKRCFFLFWGDLSFNNSYHLTFTACFPFKSSYAKRQLCALQIISTVSSEHALVMSQPASLSLWSSCFYYTMNPQLMERASRRAIVKYWNIDKRSSQSLGDRWLHTEKSWRTLMLRLGKRNVYGISVSKAKPKHKWSNA